MKTLLTTVQIAARIGCADRTVRRRAADLKIGQMVGKQMVFTEEDAKKLEAAIRPGQPGNPRIAEQSAAGVKARKNLKNK